jgi:hypothetical protein
MMKSPKIIFIIPVLLMVTLAPTFAGTWASNESSYKFGESTASNDISECLGEDDAQPGCISPSYACDVNSSNEDAPTPNTNTTACIDGYVDQWKHWCLKNTDECAHLVINGFFPGIVYNATTAPQVHYDSEFLTGIALI